MSQARRDRPHLEVWAFDEHRIGLQPILRRVCAPVGQRPHVVVRPCYQWRYVHGFVEPSTGRTFWWLTSWADTQAFNLVLQEFARWAGVSEEAHHKQVLFILDGASWHRSAHVQLPAGLTLLFLPPYSPELQPAERLWLLTNEGICNQHFDSIEDLEQAQCRRCCQLQQQTLLVRSYTRFHWWII